MKSKYNNIKKLTTLALVSMIFFYANVFANGLGYYNYGTAKTQDTPGKTTGHSAAGRHIITIQDDDGIESYSIYQNDGTNAIPKDDKKPPVPQKDVNANCTKKDVTVSLDSNIYGTSFRVQYKDCAKNKSAWRVQDFYTHATNGKPLPYNDKLDVDSDVQVIPQLDLADMNSDGIIDVVVLDNKTGRLSVFIGNGDGSLQEPSIGFDRVVRLPGYLTQD